MEALRAEEEGGENDQAQRAPRVWNRSLSKRVAVLACSVRTLIGDGLKPDIADNEHAQAALRLREIFQIVSAAVRNGHAALGGIMAAECRASLLSAGLVLQRTAPSSRRAREEMQRTASLILVTLFSDVAVSDNSLVCAAQTRVDHWLDVSWCSEIDGTGGGGEEGTPADCGTASCTESLADEALRDLSFAYFVRVATETRGGVLTAAAQERGLPPVTGMTATQLLDHEPTQGIVDAADAELGQQVFRDLILSFTMPRRHVRTRRMLLFERVTSRLAEVHHAKMLNRAHNAAMQMPSHVWRHGVVERVDQPVSSADFLVDAVEESTNGFLQEVTDDAFVVERTCALLTGLSMLVAEDADEARTGDAFMRLVELPFLATLPPSRDAKRLALSGGCWFYYTNRERGPVIHQYGRGLGALAACSLALLDDRAAAR